MAPSTLVLNPDTTSLPRDAGKSSSHTQITTKPTEATIRTIDDLIRHRATTFPDAVLASYPSAGIEYVDYTAQSLDTFAYRVGRHYQNIIPSRKSSSEKPTVVGLLGPSNLEYMITMLALIKLGHTILFLSTRISAEAVESLMTTTGAQFLVADSRHLETAHKAVASSQVPVVEIASRGVFDFPVKAHGDTRLDAQLDPAIETKNIIYIIHSSGMPPFVA
jgi:acyl-CoA synthetase (AMP-forming)/AMP-acid ligase II